MKRKVIQLAGKTLVVSLPSAWARSVNLKKGAEVEIEQNSHSLILSPGEIQQSSKTEINVSRLNASLIWHAVVGAYIKGSTEIIVNFEHQSTFDPRTGQQTNIISYISKLTNLLTGMDIVSQGDNHCVLKELSKGNQEELSTALRRIFVTLAVMAKTGDVSMEEKINKFNLFGMRMLNQMTGKDSAWKHAHLLAFQHLESLGDLLLKKSPDATVSAKMIDALHKYWYSPTNENLTALYELRHNSRSNEYLDRLGEHCMDIALARLTMTGQDANS